jgi:hypothetical protein
MSTLAELEQIQANRKSLSADVAELRIQLKKFDELDEDMRAAVDAVEQTLTLLARVRKSVTRIGVAAQNELIKKNLGEKASGLDSPTRPVTGRRLQDDRSR